MLFSSTRANTFPDPELTNERSKEERLWMRKKKPRQCVLSRNPLSAVYCIKGVSQQSLFCTTPPFDARVGRDIKVRQGFCCDELQLSRPWRHTALHPAGRAAGRGSVMVSHSHLSSVLDGNRLPLKVMLKSLLFSSIRGPQCRGLYKSRVGEALT